MARAREFDADTALDRGDRRLSASTGFEGASAEMLVGAMGIGRQSLYDTFGDKWRLYRSAVQRYGMGRNAPRTSRRSAAAFGPSTGLRRCCVGSSRPPLSLAWASARSVSSGVTRPDLAEVHTPLAKTLREAIAARVRDAQQDGDAAAKLDAEAAAMFLVANIAGIRVAGRGGRRARGLDRPRRHGAEGRCASHSLFFDHFLERSFK